MNQMRHSESVATLFISDLHLTAERPRTNEELFVFLEHDAVSADALYILGDLFEYWIGDDAAEALGHEAVLRALRRLTDRGTPVFFMHGNRDFLVDGEFSRRTGCRILTDPTVVELYGEPVLLTHGDRLCTEDHAHQEFRKLVGEPAWQHSFLAKSIAERTRLATGARQQSELNKSLMSMEIMDVNQDAVEVLMRDYGVGTLIHGHTHRPAVHHFSLDGTPVRRIVLGDWYEQGSVLWYSDRSVRLNPAGPTS